MPALFMNEREKSWNGTHSNIDQCNIAGQSAICGKEVIVKLDFYYVNSDYLEFLKDREKAARGFTCIPNTEYASGNTKFFYGAVLEMNNINFFVPVSSKLHYKQDDMLIKGKDKKNPYLGTLRFRYMVPVPRNCLSLLVRDDLSSSVQGERVRKELAFCRKNKDKIYEQARRTYERVVNRVDEGLIKNSCDFKLLEAAYLEYVARLEKKDSKD